MDADLTLQPEPPFEDAPAHDLPAPRWQRELPRWLATLNPGRTPHEYEKAVRYFFETPGVPDTLSDLTYDLLLAYRGALALRALPHHQQPRPRPSGQRVSFVTGAIGTTERIGQPSDDAEASHTADEEGERASQAQERAGRDMSSPLAPATVNIRLTALRQFLCFCALSGALPQLSPDRVRGALRRLTIERRRPYQVLAEAEWEYFLAAALAPGGNRESAGGTKNGEHKQSRGPWGVTRAERAAMPQIHAEAQPAVDSDDVGTAKSIRARLTGKRTAQRDYALIALALGTGLRAIELISLDVGDLRRERHAGQDEWWLVLPDEKTKGQHGGRTLPLASSLIETLLEYVQATGRRWEDARDRKTPLFLSSLGRARINDGDTESKTANGRQRRLSPSHVRLIVDRVERQWRQSLERERGDGMFAGEGRAISPHALRHSTAVALLEGNEAQGRPPASVEHVRGWLGHFDIRTTQGYLAHLDARRHRRPFTLAPTSAHPASQQSAHHMEASPDVESGE